MNLLTRAKDVLLTPRTSWLVIATEKTDATTLYTRYLVILAAIPAVAGFVATSLIGVGSFGATIRVPLTTGLIRMILGYAVSLAMVYAISLIASRLAPGFGGQRSFSNALKLIAYSSTAAMVGGIFILVPALAILTLAAALYSLYLLFLGVPLLMRVPDEKALPYTAVLVACAIVLGAIASIATGTLQGASASVAVIREGENSRVPALQATIDTQKVVITTDEARLETWEKQMEALSLKVEKAQQSGDQAAMEQVLREIAQMQNAPSLAK